MHVKFIGITQSHVEIEGKGKFLSAEELLVYIARVSNPSNQANTETADSLIGYMIRNKHWSPFDMANLIVEVKTSKAVGIQILRHWSIKPQEFSQRYAKVESMEPIELRKAGATDRQSSGEVFDPIIPGIDGKGYKASLVIDEIIDSLQVIYNQLLDAEVAKECARMILPMTSSTTFYLNGSVRSWIHYLQQRTDLHAQYEHRLVANEIKKIFMEHFPSTSKALGLS